MVTQDALGLLSRDWNEPAQVRDGRTSPKPRSPSAEGRDRLGRLQGLGQCMLGGGLGFWSRMDHCSLTDTEGVRGQPGIAQTPAWPVSPEHRSPCRQTAGMRARGGRRKPWRPREQHTGPRAGRSAPICPVRIRRAIATAGASPAGEGRAPPGRGHKNAWGGGRATSNHIKGQMVKSKPSIRPGVPFPSQTGRCSPSLLTPRCAQMCTRLPLNPGSALDRSARCFPTELSTLEIFPHQLHGALNPGCPQLARRTNQGAT